MKKIAKKVNKKVEVQIMSVMFYIIKYKINDYIYSNQGRESYE